MANYVIGVDFGTLSGRAILTNAQTGQISAESVLDYPHGVMTEQGPAWALHDPMDYLVVLEYTIPTLLRESGVRPEDVAAIGWDVTSCTMLPTLADGTPLCKTPEFSEHPHAYVKLWKHLAAAPQARRIEELAQREQPERLADYGGKVSSQWMLPKVLQIVEEAPEVYQAADLFLEVIDWLTLVLTGNLVRSSCGVGFKSFWSQERGYPSEAFLKQLHPALETLFQKQLRGPICHPWEAAGGLTKEWAERLGLCPGTVVAASIIDAHAGLAGCEERCPQVCVLNCLLVPFCTGVQTQILDRYYVGRFVSWVLKCCLTRCEAHLEQIKQESSFISKLSFFFDNLYDNIMRFLDFLDF